jgi:hypothetical protein
VHFRVERPSSGGIAQWGDRFGVTPLLRQRDAEIERRIGVVGAVGQHGAKRSLRLRKLLLLQMLPSLREARVGRPRAHRRGRAPSVTSSSGQ